MNHNRVHPRSRPARPVRMAAVIALAVAAGIITLPATAMAANWGPRSSFYDNIKRVTGNGTLTRLTTGSRSYAKACDNFNEGWPVYAYTDMYAFTNAAHATGGVDHFTTAQSAGCIDKTWTKGWTTFFGFWTTAGACAQIGWPVPDSCTSPASEAHTP